MFLNFTCTCRRHLRVPIGLAGRQVRCPACMAVVFAPAGIPFAMPVEAPVAAPPVKAEARLAKNRVPPPSSTALSRIASAIAVAGGGIFIVAAAFVGIRCPEALLPISALAAFVVVSTCFAGRRQHLSRETPPRNPTA